MKQINSQKSIIKQNGAAVLLVSIALLIGVTLITIFASRVGVMDQRIAGNEYRHKEAFSAANAALDQGAAYLEKNNELYDSTHASWVACTGGLATQFPCQVVGASVTDNYEFAYDGNLATTNIIEPLENTVSLANVASDSYMVFTTSATIGNLITVLGTGESADGTGEAIAQLSYAKTTTIGIDKLPPVLAPIANLSGSFMIVADPQMNLLEGADCSLGRVSFEDPKSATDISVWTTTATGANGSWQTCLTGDYQNAAGEECADVYDSDTPHATWTSCTCNDVLSTGGGGGPADLDYDIRIEGTNSTTPFPASPLDYIFGTSDMGTISTLADDSLTCAEAGTNDYASQPFIFVNEDCSFGSIGTQLIPVFIVVNGDLTITSNSDIWGIMISNGDITFNGNPMVHGSVVSEDPTNLTNGNYTQVFDWCVGSNLIKSINEPKLLKIKYSWRNFNP